MKESSSDRSTATTHNPVAIANYFIKLNNRKEEKGLTIMQLLKLSYIAHGFKLALIDEPLSDEAVLAWKYGPVFSRIYDAFKRGPYEVKKFALELDDVTETLVPVTSNFNNDEKRIIRVVYDIYGDIDGWRLSALTHKKGTPWYDVHKEDQKQGIYGTSIPNQKIKEYFKREVIDKYFGEE